MNAAVRLRSVLYLAAGVAVLASLGCAGDRPVAADAVNAPYPAEAAHVQDVDVVVVRHGTEIELVNREARTFPAGQLWLNQTYMREIGPVAIGTNDRIALWEFHNGFGEGYPLGSFLRPEQNRRLVHAELYDPQSQTRYRLTVQPEKQPR